MQTVKDFFAKRGIDDSRPSQSHKRQKRRLKKQISEPAIDISRQESFNLEKRAESIQEVSENFPIRGSARFRQLLFRSAHIKKRLTSFQYGETLPELY